MKSETSELSEKKFGDEVQEFLGQREQQQS